MTELQSYLLKLLHEIDCICLEHGIEYYIFAGSMLGVERNEGFLPWDDDIDIIMTEKNYKKFSHIMKNNPPQNRKFECIEYNDEYPLQFGKYISTDVSGIIRPHAYNNCVAGLWIDVIHVSPLPVAKWRRNLIKKWFCCYCELENDSYVEYKNHYKGFYPRYRFALFLSSIFGRKRVISWLKKMFDNFPEEKCEKYLMYHSLYTDYREFEKCFFEKPLRKNYAGIEVNVCPYNREFCRLLYGDSWMIIPEESEQDVHTMVLDFDIPYDRYVNDYMIFLDKNEVLNTIAKTKQVQMKKLTYQKNDRNNSIHLRGLLLNEKLKLLLNEKKVNLTELVENEQYEAIGQLFEEYIALQFDPVTSYWKVFVPLDDEMLIPVLNKLVCYDGKYYSADKIIQLRENYRKDGLNEKFTGINNLIKYCRELSIAHWDKNDFELLNDILKDKGNFNNQFCVDILLAECYSMIHFAQNKEEYIAARQKICEILDRIPSHGESIKLLGDVEIGLGNISEALKYYSQAEELTRNGLVLLDIQKKREKYDDKR